MLLSVRIVLIIIRVYYELDLFYRISIGPFVNNPVVTSWSFYGGQVVKSMYERLK